MTYNLLDEYCPETRTSSIAHTTNYTATAAANMLLDGLCPEKGVLPPELIGKDETCFRYIMDYLTQRGVKLTSTWKCPKCRSEGDIFNWQYSDWDFSRS